MLTKDEMKAWLRSAWYDIKGESTRNGHPAPYPIQLAERLIKMFSFAGDVILDPFSGTGSTSLAAMKSGRSSIGSEIQAQYHKIARDRLVEASSELQLSGAVETEIVLGSST
jgi:site-specific DNA-methyltransferase (adenine-specific)